MTHYDRYPYPDPSQYLPWQIKHLRTEGAPRRDTWGEWFPGEEPAAKRVLVVGCGMFEALAVAAQEPLLLVTALDSSSHTIALSQALALKAELRNVEFVTADLLDFTADPYDLVIASGVLHHVPDHRAFVHKLRALTKDRGVVKVMVYGDQVRGFVRDFCGLLFAFDAEQDEDGIAFVRRVIEALPAHHPVKGFWECCSQTDSQVIDTWLHPFFVHYQADTLLLLMERNGFCLARWLNDAADYTVLRGLLSAEQTQCFDALPERARCRMGQVFNHADAQLAALFQAV